jgi:fumarylacetoacetase
MSERTERGGSHEGQPPRSGTTGPFDLPDGHPFGIQNLPFGRFTIAGGSAVRVGVAYGEHVLDIGAVCERLLPQRAGLFAGPKLEPFLASGPEVWAEIREQLTGWLGDGSLRETIAAHLVPRRQVRMRLPFDVADYVDFYSSEHHAGNIGQIFRPGQPPLTPNWRHLPIGYHGRAGTVVVSGTDVIRPRGQRRDAEGNVHFGPSIRLDIEAEVGFVVGVGSEQGRPVPLADFDRHVFGVCLVNDWSARDIQAWEYVPLGPFLGKSFATSISPWLVPLSALRHARVAPPPRDPRPLEYLDDTGAQPWGLDLTLRVELNGQQISAPPFATMYWTPAQQLAHLTVNGASARTGDLFASGTVSGPGENERGSLIELTWDGATPLTLADGTTRTYLRDGDRVTITATAPGPGSSVIGFGEVTGTILPAI